MFADQSRRNLLEEVEARPPHQRAIAENPEVAADRSVSDEILVDITGTPSRFSSALKRR
ncbi:MAG: hypothetical protein WDN50_17550 [Bradyrhizobium sp.]